MRRREFIAVLGASAAWPVVVRAQQPATQVIGFLGIGPPVASNLAGLRKGLGEAGFAEGRNVAIVFRNTEQYDQLPALASDLVQQKVAVIVTASSVDAARAAKAATTTIPIVFALGTSPVEVGLVPSLGRPGGNATGVTYLAEELAPKRLELLRELVPQATTVAHLVNPSNSATESNIRNAQAAASRTGQRIIVVGASTAREIEAAFEIIVRERAGGLLIGGDAFLNSRREQIVTLAARHALPAVYFDPNFTEAGGLVSYSDDRIESWRQAGLYVGRILKGEKPADLPVLQPTKFELKINLKTARALGIDFPPSFHLRATEVIE
jgi:putative tryptophan/tyrosine transport system substrate-binding protein